MNHYCFTLTLPEVIQTLFLYFDSEVTPAKPDEHEREGEKPKNENSGENESNMFVGIPRELLKVS